MAVTNVPICTPAHIVAPFVRLGHIPRFGDAQTHPAHDPRGDWAPGVGSFPGQVVMPGYPFGTVEDRRATAREYVDAGGSGWRVYELPAVAADHALQQPCLIFENHGVIRRVHDFPEDWRALTDAELSAVSWHA